jgi:hypothetical protein
MLDRRSADGRPVWSSVALTDHAGPAAPSDTLDRMTLPPRFANALLPLLVPGTSLYCALASANPDTRTGPGFTVIATQPA